MSFLNGYVMAILITYLLAFFIQNYKTTRSAKKPIRGKSLKLYLSLLLSTLLYLLTFGMLVYPKVTTSLWPIKFLQAGFVQISGIVVMTIALAIGLAALFEMKNSWRVGIRYEQKTRLVTTGVYSLSRNPYFLSYDLMFAGIFLVFPNYIILMLTIGIMMIFHKMILEEERYLSVAQGARYHQYKAKTRRYI